MVSSSWSSREKGTLSLSTMLSRPAVTRARTSGCISGCTRSSLVHKRTSAASRASSALLGDKALVPAWCCSPDSVTHNHEICVLVVVKGLEIVRQPGQPCTSTRGEWRREERTRTQHSVCSVKYWTKAPVSLALRYAGRNKALEGGAGSST